MGYIFMSYSKTSRHSLAPSASHSAIQKCYNKNIETLRAQERNNE